MMNHDVLKMLAFIGIIAIGLAQGACSDDDDDTATSTIGFTSTTSSVSEGDGDIQIEITASTAVTSNTEIEFELSGSALLNGDYTLVTSSPVTIPAGSQTAVIALELLDERIIETSADDIVINLSRVDGEAALSSTSAQLEHTIEITDNDEVPSGQLQIDLSWVVDDSPDVDEADLDLYLFTDVVIEDNIVTDAVIYDASANSRGFESLWINEDDQDTEYYIGVNYSEGEVETEFTLNLNGGNGYVDESITETLGASDVGSAIFFGPITKEGSTIGRKSGIHRLTGLVKD